MSDLRFTMPAPRMPDLGVKPDLEALTRPDGGEYLKALQAESNANAQAASTNARNYDLQQAQLIQATGAQAARASSNVLQTVLPSALTAQGQPQPQPQAAPDQTVGTAAPIPAVTVTPLSDSPTAQSSSADAAASRGVRNRNPLNLRGGGYDGQIGVDQDGYAIFATPEDGLRAGALQNERHQQVGGAQTLADVIKRHAPASDGNDPAAYTATVAKSTGIDPNAPIDMTDPETNAKVTRAMMAVESPDAGKTYSPDTIDRSFQAAYAGIPGSAPAVRNLQTIVSRGTASTTQPPNAGADASSGPDQSMVAPTAQGANGQAQAITPAAASKATLDQIGGNRPAAAAPTQQDQTQSVAKPYLDRATQLDEQAAVFARAGLGSQALALQAQAVDMRQKGIATVRDAEINAIEMYGKDPVMGEAMAAHIGNGFKIPDVIKGPDGPRYTKAISDLKPLQLEDPNQMGTAIKLRLQGMPIDQIMQQIGPAKAKPTAPSFTDAGVDSQGNILSRDARTGQVVSSNTRAGAKPVAPSYTSTPLKDGFGNYIGALITNTKDGTTHVVAAEGAAGETGAANAALGAQDENGNIPTGDAAMKLVPPALQPRVQAILDGRAPLPAAMLRTPGGPMLINWAHQIDPTFDETLYPTRAATMRDFTSGPTSKTITALNTSVDHLGTLSDLAAALDSGQIPAINAIAQKAQTSLGLSTAPTEFNAAKQVVAGEILKAVINGPGAESDREKLQTSLNSASNPQALARVIANFKTLMGGQLHAQEQKFVAGAAGTADAFRQRFLTQATRDAVPTLRPGADGPTPGNSATAAGAIPAEKDRLVGKTRVVGRDGQAFVWSTDGRGNFGWKAE